MTATRVRAGVDTEAITLALQAIPAGLQLDTTPFIVGLDPVFIGLHGWTEADDGRPYSETAHAVWPCHMAHRPRSERTSAVVLPELAAPYVVVHELGHVLHERIGFDFMDLAPVTAYAQTNGYEAFAEAFTHWVLPGTYPWADEHMDGRAIALFEELST